MWGPSKPLQGNGSEILTPVLFDENRGGNGANGKTAQPPPASSQDSDATKCKMSDRCIATVSRGPLLPATMPGIVPGARGPVRRPLHFATLRYTSAGPCACAPYVRPRVYNLLSLLSQLVAVVEVPCLATT